MEENKQEEGLHYEVVKFDKSEIDGQSYIQILIEDELYTGWIEKK